MPGVFGSNKLVLVPAALVLKILLLKKFAPEVLMSKMHLLEFTVVKLNMRSMLITVQIQVVVFKTVMPDGLNEIDNSDKIDQSNGIDKQ